MPLQVDLKSTLSIGEVAQQARIRTSAIRYYESIGLLPEPERRSGRRLYDGRTVERLHRIALAQFAGFSLDEIRQLERGFGGDQAAPARWRELAAVKLREVDEQIGRLREMRGLLHEATRCGCNSLQRCPLMTRPRAEGRGAPRRRRGVPARR